MTPETIIDFWFGAPGSTERGHRRAVWFKKDAVFDEALRLFERLEAEPATPATNGLAEWAHKHRDIVRRFGRFPHRNAMLGRASTAEEMAFLQQPGSSF